MTNEKTMADEINEHLKAGGFVQVTTYTRSTVYQERNAGQFEMVAGSLYVRHRKRLARLSIAGRLLVGVRFGKYKKAV